MVNPKKDGYVIMLLSVYRGYVYAVVLFDDGHYTGYVRVDDESLFDKFEAEWEDGYGYIRELDDIHGGVTYLKRNDGEYLPEGNWVGFDFGHSLDGRDFYGVRKFFGEETAQKARDYYHPMQGEERVNPKIVSAECKTLVELIEKAAKEAYI